VPTYNNAKNFRYEYNLQSILNLNYKNYKVVIIDDASTDGTYELLGSFISTLQTDIRIHLIRNEMKMTAVPNIDKAIREYCH
jgi:glycosyltransferase EpsE